MSDRLIDQISYGKDGRLVTLQKIKRSKKPLYIYGAARAAQARIKWLREYGVQAVGCCVDTEYYKPGMTLEGLAVYDLSKIKQQDDEYELFIGFEDHPKAKKAVEDFRKIGRTVYYIEDPFKFRYMDYDFFLKNYSQFESAYALLEDGLSRDIFVAQLNSRISACSDAMVQYRAQSPYGYDFDLLQLSGDETFVDCGAFNGDTVEEFIRYTNGQYHKIYAFEPDPVNAGQLRDKFCTEKIAVIEKGTGKETGMAAFYADASLFSNFASSKIWWGGVARRDLFGDIDQCSEVPVTALDSELGDVPVTVIKMDIEGSELDALMGAQDIIKAQHPKLAVCVYHKQEDLFSIIHYIHGFDTEERGYKYYLRHHSDDITETVLYAVPR